MVSKSQFSQVSALWILGMMELLSQTEIIEITFGM